MPTRKSVLFLCIGNACRSQMAEGFARVYGADVMKPASAGLAPAYSIPDMTAKVMAGRNISLDGHHPKPLDDWAGEPFDLIVNMSGRKLPDSVLAPVEEWSIFDPIGSDEQTYIRVRDEIEQRVMRLILRLRAEAGGEGVHRPPPPQQPAPPKAPDPTSEPPRRRKFLR